MRVRQTTDTDSQKCILMSVAKDAFHLAYNVKMSAEDSDTAEVTLYGEIVENMPSFYKYFYPEDNYLQHVLFFEPVHPSPPLT